MATTDRGYPQYAQTDSADIATKLNAISQTISNDIDAQFHPAYTPITGLTAGANPGSPAPQYVVWADSHVELVGAITATSSFATGGVVLFTLPAGVRPAAAQAPQIFPVAWNGAVSQTPTIRVDSSGAVTLFCVAGVTAVYLNTIRFRTN